LQWSYIPVSLCPDLAEQNLEESLTDLMDRKYKIQFSTANVILRARTITPYEAKHLDVPPGSPVIYIEQITYSQTGQAVEFIQSVWRSDRYEFSYTAARTGWPLVE
jgi:GntR family transcriptional regulator